MNPPTLTVSREDPRSATAATLVAAMCDDLSRRYGRPPSPYTMDEAADPRAGFVVARFVRLYPIDAAIVNACHSGQGGTGDVAILTAGNRMQLMPFAQIATRIGGAIMVTLTLIVFARLGH